MIHWIKTEKYYTVEISEVSLYWSHGFLYWDEMQGITACLNWVYEYILTVVDNCEKSCKQTRGHTKNILIYNPMQSQSKFGHRDSFYSARHRKRKWFSIRLRNDKLGGNKKLQMEGSFPFKDGVSLYCHGPETSLLCRPGHCLSHTLSSLSSKSGPAPVCGQMVLWSYFLRDPALSAHHQLFHAKHTATQNLFPIHCPPPTVSQHLSLSTSHLFLLLSLSLFHLSPSSLLHPCPTSKVHRVCQTFVCVKGYIS